jgi:hypothetical protein
VDNWHIQLPGAAIALAFAVLFATLDVVWLACAFSWLAGVGAMFALTLWRDEEL